MSKRYGRNQKRKNRAEIARLQQSFALANGLSRDLSGSLQAANNTIAEMVRIIEAVSYNSVAIPAKEMEGNISRDYLILNQPNGLSSYANLSNLREIISYKSINLYALRAFVESRHEAIQAAVHLKYAHGNQHSTYMLSESALRSLPREALLQRLLPDIGRQLIDHLRKNQQ